ncbi:hypothetical protein HAX54_036908 [Datura stramonium]|uniref:Prefoldin subunit 6 n=2 Tax=Datura stramonium TaxID=4076 RepID=A0ABS8VHL1_DATST|nr:hypothetical protein [Datura stramonium]
MASSAALRELQRDLENKANDLSKLQKDISKNHQIRKKYTIQLGENELVLKELDLLNEDANVYKLIGPVLVKQDMAEARANVKKRIDYISAELKRLDSTLQDLEEKQNSKKETIMKLQQKIQSLQAGKGKAWIALVDRPTLHGHVNLIRIKTGGLDKRIRFLILIQYLDPLIPQERG